VILEQKTLKNQKTAQPIRALPGHFLHLSVPLLSSSFLSPLLSFDKLTFVSHLSAASNGV